MGVTAKMILKAAVRMEQRAVEASKEAKEAQDIARKADRQADKAAQKARSVKRLAKKQMLAALQFLQLKNEMVSDREHDLSEHSD
jgi:hypothetical protein